MVHLNISSLYSSFFLKKKKGKEKRKQLPQSEETVEQSVTRAFKVTSDEGCLKVTKKSRKTPFNIRQNFTERNFKI
jgi:hypothetical protein